MDQKRENIKQDARLEDNVSRAQSQDLLDSSSASSLSFFADNNDTSNDYPHDRTKITEDQRVGQNSPSGPIDEALKSEKAFIEFVMSLPPKESSEHHQKITDSVMSKAKIPAPAANSTKVGLDHLDNLCKLMEQLSELRETNNKLQRRVQYLEDLKILHDMHKEITEDAQYSSEDALTSKPRPYELQKSATESCYPKKEDTHIVHSARTHSRYQNRRGRAQSTDGPRRERSKSVGHEDAGEDTKSKRIFPKWSKVKEAFGWESDRKDSVKKGDCDSGNIRSPRRCSDDTHQNFHPPKSPTWSHDFPSLHSSLEDVHEILDSGRWKRSSVMSEKNIVYLDTAKECLRRQKSTPSPGSEKLMQFREVSELKPKSSTIERDSYSQQDYGKFEKDDGKRGKSPWGRVKTIIEKRRDSLKRRSLRRDHACTDCDSTAHKMPGVAEIKSYADYVESSVRQPIISDPHKHKTHVLDPIVIDEEVDYGGPRTPSSSPTFHRKSRWTRVKKALKGKKEDEHDPSLSTPASPSSGQDGHFTFDIVEDQITQDSCDDGRVIKRVGSDSHVHQISLSEPTCDLMLQLQRNLSEDFHRKIMEWERIRASGSASYSPQWDRKASMATRSRKKSERDDKNIKPKLKDLTWLEKELQKIEKEKQRLSKEKQKYEERALRLEKLKETVLNAKNSNKREVLVRTSAGEFRFEGISDAFTKKLYEWETKRGLGPELSTIALLDSSRLIAQPSIGPKSEPLQRVVSRSESSIADIGQPSHNSSNSLPSLKIPDAADADRTNHPSRANSEPDLSTLVALTNGRNVSVTNLSRQVGDSLDDEITGPGVSRESEEDDLDKKRNDSETYYGLLEENVILLEQLKDKEDICGRLQTELEVLDKKVEVMNKHHTQETERYREKLWEMHKPGATPRDQQSCLLTMSQLRNRIEVLENCTEKLRIDRESIEDSFRYHSKQQEDMTLDLLQKMSELQAAGSSTAECESHEYIPPRVEASAVERLQDLSALLVRQTQELQETLSVKTKQICQLRWELLHRDLSTVKLETELHTHTAHRKRSKYAHYRSHSSEEAAVVHLPQELECGKSTIITDSIYNVSPETDFQATELTNTVQQLNREVLKLAGAADGVADDNASDGYMEKLNNENIWLKTNQKSRIVDKSKQITVRRTSAENVNLVLRNDQRWKPKEYCSSESDDSSDDGYTKISLRPNARNYYPNSNVERLLMSSGEHAPRGYLQRRKMLQKLSKSSYSPSRRRSNTFHNKRDFEKPASAENTPQKCYSFRFSSEKNIDYYDYRDKFQTVNIQKLLGEVKYQEYLNKKAQIDRNSSHQTQQHFTSNSSKVGQSSVPDCQWLREVSSDSKIPLLFQLQYRTDELLRDRDINKCPIRSHSDKHGKETAAERRENFQKRKVKKHLTSPDLFANLNDTLKARLLAQSKAPNREEPSGNFNTNIGCPSKRYHSEKVSFSPNIPFTDSGNTITVQLPKRKSKKNRHKTSHDSFDNTEQTFTITMPKKRSLSSEKEDESSFKNTCNSKAAEMKETHSCHNHEASRVPPLPDIKLYPEEFIQENIELQRTQIISIEKPAGSTVEPLQERLQNEHISRKRKADDADSLSRDQIDIGDERITDKNSYVLNQNNSGVFLNHDTNIIPSRSTPTYVKSPSAPHLDWRKTCAKKVSREEASNVRSLIEKYNKVAENKQGTSSNSINLSSPTWNKKMSAPLSTSRSYNVIPSQSASTPTTPNIISASVFYNPLIFKPVDLDLFPKSAPESPLSAARTEAIKKAKEQFIASQNTSYLKNRGIFMLPNLTLTGVNDDKSGPVNHGDTSLPASSRTDNMQTKPPDDDRLSNCSMDSSNLVMFRTGETCQESRFSKRSGDYSRTESDTLDRRNNLKTSKSLSSSSIFKSVLSSDFKMPSSLLKLKRSKRKKDMSTVSQLCRQSLLLTTDDADKITPQSTHKSCPSSPELKSKTEVKSNWFHRNILRHK